MCTLMIVISISEFEQKQDPETIRKSTSMVVKLSERLYSMAG